MGVQTKSTTFQYSEQDLEAIRREFDLVRRRQFWLGAANVLASLLLFFLRRREILTGDLFALAIGVVFLVSFALAFQNWRCPVCNAPLGRSGGYRGCPGCGVPLR